MKKEEVWVYFHRLELTLMAFCSASFLEVSFHVDLEVRTPASSQGTLTLLETLPVR